jgi:hypothetical protein
VPQPPRKLRVLFVTEDDPIYVIRFFDTFLVEYPRQEFELVGRTIVAPFRESLAATARRVLSLTAWLRRFASRSSTPAPGCDDDR